MKKFYMYLSTIIGILGFIGGIVLGFIYKIPSEYSFSDPSFNWWLMIISWISTFLLVSIFAGIYEILDYEETNYSNIYDLHNRIYQIKNNLESIEKNSTK